jgi:hypothetical protein
MVKDRKAMSMEEIKKVYSGKWIFSIHTKDNPFSAVPVILADRANKC